MFTADFTVEFLPKVFAIFKISKVARLSRKYLRTFKDYLVSPKPYEVFLEEGRSVHVIL